MTETQTVSAFVRRPKGGAWRLLKTGSYQECADHIASFKRSYPEYTQSHIGATAPVIWVPPREPMPPKPKRWRRKASVGP